MMKGTNNKPLDDSVVPDRDIKQKERRTEILSKKKVTNIHGSIRIGDRVYV